MGGIYGAVVQKHKNQREASGTRRVTRTHVYNVYDIHESNLCKATKSVKRDGGPKIEQRTSSRNKDAS